LETGDTKQPAEIGYHAPFGQGHRSDDVVERDSNPDGEDHGTEHRHAQQPSDGERRSRYNPIQEQARQNFAGLSAHRWLAGRGEVGIDLSFTHSASFVLEIKVMSWLHRPSNSISFSHSINLTNKNCRTNQFYRSIKT
jgi:hypothetical protein